ncbi:uncharacterized protein [Hetaerina americana]|uniref:uncharacterized protein isoform X2 n=1 Tax=Hetaerina americana TaxID=62018 RepID=UPI003A7F1130
MDDKLLGMPQYSFVEVGGPIRSGFLFLLHLAWESRFRLPILLVVGLMVLDVRMQLEIDFDAELMQERRMQLVRNIEDGDDEDDEGEDDYSDEDEFELDGDIEIDDDGDSDSIDDEDYTNYTSMSDSYEVPNDGK